MTSGFSEMPHVLIERKAGQKTLRMRITRNAVVVSVPARVAQADVDAFIGSHRQWIETKWVEMCRRLHAIETELEQRRGQVLLGGVWKPVFGLKSTKRQVELAEMPEKAVLRYNAAKITSKLVTKALVEKARLELPAHVRRLSKQTGIPFNDLTVRNQQSRWGSCSSKGNLNLNWRLIKCAPLFRDYVIVHELAHTIEFNHSKAFWSLVHKLMPDYRQALAWIAAHGPMVFAPEPEQEPGFR